MSIENTADPVAEALAIRERGVAHLAGLREKAAARRSREAALAQAEDAELLRAEQEFAEALAIKESEARLSQAIAAHHDAQRSYDEHRQVADDLASELLADQAALIEKFFAAREAEQNRVGAGELLRHTHAQLNSIQPTSDPRVDHDRFAGISLNSPYLGIGRLVVAALGPGDPRTRNLRVAR